MSLSAESKRRLLNRAEDLANDLAGGGATRSEWRHVVDALYLTPGEPGQRLEKARELVEVLPRSGLSGRSGKTRRQLKLVCSTFQGVLRKHYCDEELRFLLGWTTRLLDTAVKEEKQGVEGKPWDTAPRRAQGASAGPSGTSSATPGPRTGEAPKRQTWPGATLSYNAGGGRVFTAVAADRSASAEARQDEAKKIIESLSSDAQAWMIEGKKKKPIRADVDVERRGASWALVGVLAEIEVGPRR